MKTLILALVLLLPACTTPPPVSGSVESKFGGITLLPDGLVKSYQFSSTLRSIDEDADRKSPFF